MAEQDSANSDNEDKNNAVSNGGDGNAVDTSEEERQTSTNQKTFDRARDGQSDPDSAAALKDSGTVLEEHEDSGKLRDQFTGSGETLPEHEDSGKPVEDQENSGALRDEFAGSGDPHDLPPGAPNDRSGRVRDRNTGRITNMAIQQMSMGQMFSVFIELIAALIRGDMESFSMLSERFKEAKADPRNGAAVKMKKVLDRTVEQAESAYESAGLDKKTPEERKEFFSSMFEQNAFLKASGVSKLFDLIVEKESRGGDPDIVYDYRNKLTPGTHNLGGATTGLQPGDTTPGGLKVPEFTQMTVNQVIDWQKQYLEEQYAVKGRNGEFLIPRGTGSSAVGAYQFVSRTLAEMRDEGLIDGNDKFTLENQTEFAIKRMIDQRGFAGVFADNTTRTDLINIAHRLRSEWEGAKSIPINDLADTLADIRSNVLNNLDKATFANAKDFDITASVPSR